MITRRKIDAMHMLFGVLPDKRCEDCSHLIKGRYHDMILRKCTVYGATHSEASDWRKKYVACGLFNKPWSGGEVIKALKRKNAKKVNEVFPIDGQIGMFEQEGNT